MTRPSRDRRPPGARTQATRPRTPSGALTFWASPMTSTSAAKAPTGFPARSDATLLPGGAGPGPRAGKTLPGHRQDRSGLPRPGLDGPSLGESVDEGANNLDAAIRTGWSRYAIGLSEGFVVLDAEQARLANDPRRPRRDQLSFATFGDPIARHALGSELPDRDVPGRRRCSRTRLPVPPPFESQYDTKVFVSAYDSIADFPDRPDNLFALGNALMGLATGHTAVASPARAWCPRKTSEPRSTPRVRRRRRI